MSTDPTSAQQHQVSNFNIANVLTVLRIAMVPLFGWALLHDGGDSPTWRWVAFALFAIAMITDKIDGDLARKHNLITDFGKIADPIADKALIGAALIGLSILAEISWWVTGLVLVREIGVTVLRFVVIRHGVMAASRGGKAKTLLQAVAIGLYILPLGGVLHAIAAVVMAVAVIVTLATGVHYVARAFALRRTSDRTVRRRAVRERLRDDRDRAGGAR